MSCDQESQQDEMLALASIYDDSTFYVSNVAKGTEALGGQFSANLELPQPFTVCFSKGTDKATSKVTTHDVQFLPPLTLYFQLPVDYPSARPPAFTLACKWLTLSQMSQLCQKLDEIWEENHGEVILFLWTSFLRDEALEFLEIGNFLDLSSVVQRKRHCSGNHQTTEFSKTQHAEKGSLATDGRVIQDIASQDLLLPAVLEHDKAQRQFVFQNTLFTCQVCFVEKLGGLCMSFPACDHVYCKDCMRGYFEVQINEGNVQSLTCPSDQCDSQALPSQVKELVGNDLFSRYDRLLLQSSLDTMSDIMYCPRKLCQSVVLVDQESNMGQCPSCHFAFCIFCKLVYHGVSPCRLKAEEVKKLRGQYLEATESEKKQMERQYGRQCIRQIIEDSFTEEWLEEHSKKCPHCGTHIQKVDGCNKMTCTKCRSFFCWLCLGSLPRNNPYRHFGDPSSDCFNKLFQGMTMVDNEWEEEEEPEWIT